MLSTNTQAPNSFTIKRYVPVGNVELELKRNPSAKVFREIQMTVGGETVELVLGSVTKEAANGGYHNGAINRVEVSIDSNTFFDGDESALTNGVLGSESYAVITKVLAIRSALVADKDAVKRVIGLMANV